MSGSASTEPPSPAPPGLAGSCVVLGGGGLTGIAWLGGVLDELPAVLQAADRVVGTSGGALLAARLLNGAGASGLPALLAQLDGVRLRPAAVARLIAAQVWPSRRHALQWLGRHAMTASSLPEPEFVRLVRGAIGADAWPASLIVVAVDAASGRPAYFTPRSGVPLARAVAASCAMPGVLPPVRIEDRHYLDGGLRSPANADLATGCARVLVLAPQWRSARVVRRPEHQVDKLRAEGAQVLLARSPNTEHQVLSASVLPAAEAAGRRQGRALAAEVSRLWPGADRDPDAGSATAGGR